MSRRTPSPAIAQLMSEITPQEKRQTRTKMGLAARISDLIRTQSMSKSEFAEKMSKNPSEISKWLSGTHNFTIDTLVEIATALNVEVGELFVSEQKPVTIYPIALISPVNLIGEMRQSFKTNTP